MEDKETSIDEVVHLVPYDPEWVKDFDHEKIRLEQVLNDPALAFEHIGSTAIYGLLSKPIIDIMIGIENYPPSSTWINKLCAHGYSYYGEAGVPERLYFTQRARKNYNLAVVLHHGKHWQQNIAFRNFLRAHPEDCREYETVKICAINSGAAHLLAYSMYKYSYLRNLFEKINKNITG